MLTHPTCNRLVALGLTGMAKAFDEQQQQPDVAALGFDERFAFWSIARRPNARTSDW
jgi:hypothetical protein